MLEVVIVARHSFPGTQNAHLLVVETHQFQESAKHGTLGNDSAADAQPRHGFVGAVLIPQLAAGELEEAASHDEYMIVQPDGALSLAVWIIARANHVSQPQPVRFEHGQQETRQVDGVDRVVYLRVGHARIGQALSRVDLDSRTSRGVQHSDHRPVHVGERPLALHVQREVRRQVAVRLDLHVHLDEVQQPVQAVVAHHEERAVDDVEHQHHHALEHLLLLLLGEPEREGRHVHAPLRPLQRQGLLLGEGVPRLVDLHHVAGDVAVVEVVLGQVALAVEERTHHDQQHHVHHDVVGERQESVHLIQLRLHLAKDVVTHLEKKLKYLTTYL